MGDLVVMSRAKALPPRDLVAGHSAEIHFFTGVRYYRMDDAAELPVQAERTTPKRRRSPDHRRTKLPSRQRHKALA